LQEERLRAVSSIHQPEYKRLLEELIKAREKADITQQELADMLKKPQSFVSKYENGERRLDIIELTQIADLIGTDYKKLVDSALQK
jgi:transcriptional regulator with XRE-family HTH domain